MLALETIKLDLFLHIGIATGKVGVGTSKDALSSDQKSEESATHQVSLQELLGLE